MKTRSLIIFILALSLTGCGASGKGGASQGGADDPVIAESRESREQLQQAIENAKAVLPDDAVARLEGTEEGTAGGTDSAGSAESGDGTGQSGGDTDAGSSDTAAVEVSTSTEELQQMLKDNEDLVFYPNVPNDSTGQMRIAVYSSASTPESIALDYYRAFFEDDSEIHGLINQESRTTARLSASGDSIDIMLYEYVDNEEIDAELTFTGAFSGEYSINKSTGEILKVQ